MKVTAFLPDLAVTAVLGVQPVHGFFSVTFSPSMRFGTLTSRSRSCATCEASERPLAQLTTWARRSTTLTLSVTPPRFSVKRRPAVEQVRPAEWAVARTGLASLAARQSTSESRSVA